MRRRRIGFRGILLGLGLCALLCAPVAAEHYRVKAGDNLYKIGKKFHVSPESIRQANGLEGNALKVNQNLVIPGGKPQREGQERAAAKKNNGGQSAVHVVKKGETLAAVSEKTGVSVSEIKRLNGLKTSRLKPGQRLVLAKSAVRAPEDEEELEEAGSVETDELVSLDEERESPRPKAPVALSRWSDPAERDLFVKVVKSYEGVPYRLGGNSMRGIDCSAFTRKVYGIFSVDLPRTAREQLQCGTRVGRDSLDTGDLVFFQTRKYRIHVGIFLGGNEFFHLSSRNRAGKVDNIDSAYFSARFISGVRLKEVDRRAKSETPKGAADPPAVQAPAVSPSAGAAHSPEG
jgi:cell wall-associated NlpC family hydrolase